MIHLLLLFDLGDLATGFGIGVDDLALLELILVVPADLLPLLELDSMIHLLLLDSPVDLVHHLHLLGPELGTEVLDVLHRRTRVGGEGHSHPPCPRLRSRPGSR